MATSGAKALPASTWPKRASETNELKARLRSAECRSLTRGCPPPSLEPSAPTIRKPAKCCTIRPGPCERCGGVLFPDEDPGWLYCLQCGSQLQPVRPRPAPAHV